MKAGLTILSPLVPYPPHSGGAAHISNAIRQLSESYLIQLYALAAAPESVRWGSLAEWCAEVYAFRPTPRAAFTLDPPAVRRTFSAELVSRAHSDWSQRPPAIVQLEFSDMAQYAPLARQYGALVVCTAHNVAFLAQVRRARQQRGLALQARRWLGALSLWLYELRALRRCHLIVTLSEIDAAMLKRWLPRLPVVHVPSGVDLSAWPVCFDPQVENRVLFVGNYYHPPNVEGATWLARQVWPLVRRQQPGAQLILAGREPPPAIQSLAAPDIQIPGTVEDLRDCYRRASVVTAPIFWGSGVRIKLLEALACGLPVVTTALAAEGLELLDDQSALFAEHPEDFAATIVRLLRDQQLRARIGAAGREVVERHYDWKIIGRRLIALYEDARAQLR